MGETGPVKEEKPGGAKPSYRGRRGGARRFQTAAKTATYRGPTVGYEEYIYDVGAAKHAAQYIETTERLTNYFQSSYTMGSDIAQALQNLTDLAITMPTAPVARKAQDGSDLPITSTDEHIFKRTYDAAHKKHLTYEENKKKAYAVIYEHSTHELKAQLKALPEWMRIETDQDPIALLERIKGLCCKFDSNKHPTRAMVAADKSIFLFQQKDLSNNDYHERFNALITTAESYGSSIGVSKALLTEELNEIGKTSASATPDELRECKAKAKEKYLAMLLLDGANWRCFGELRKELDRDYAKGTDSFPTTRAATLRLMNEVGENKGSRVPARDRAGGDKQDDDAVMFAQDGGHVERRSCHNCGERGHLAYNCPKGKKDAGAKQPDEKQLHNMVEAEEQMHTMMEAVDMSDGDEDLDDVDGDDDAVYFFHQRTSRALNRNWVLLDSQSSTDMFCNKSFLSNVTESTRPTVIHCNAGATTCTQEGVFVSRVFGSIPVKYHPDGICNVISLKTMKKLFPVSFTSDPRDSKKASFKVHTPAGVAEFKECDKGLHYYDLTGEEFAFAQTVAQSFEGYTKREVQKAIQARRLQGMVGGPAMADYEGMVREKLIDDCPISINDLKNAHSIFGPDLAGLRGRTVRRKPERVETEIVAVPRDFVRMHKFVVLTADVMFVNGVPLLLTRSRGVQLITVEYLPRRTAKFIGHKLTRVLQLYHRAGFIVQQAHMDREFEAVRDECPQLPINTTARNEHVPEAERCIRLVKERTRGVESTLPFTGVTRVMIIELVHFVVLWLNNFPVKSGISTKYSPRELICRHKQVGHFHKVQPEGADMQAQTQRQSPLQDTIWNLL